MCVYSHKFPACDADFFHLKAIKQNASVDIQDLHSKSDRTQDFTLSVYSCNLASSLKSTFMFP